MSSTSRRYLGPYLAVLIAGLAAVNWWVASKPIDLSPLKPGPADSGSEASASEAGAKDLEDRTLRPLQDLSETRTRPLFRSDRRPAPVKPQDSTVTDVPRDPELSAGTLRLVGMMRNGLKSKRALIRVTGAPAAIWVEVGGQVGGWTVGQIDKDRVVMMRNGSSAELKLNQLKPASAPAQPQ